MIKYFLACLTIPENDQWVNLSPYEKQRIIPEDLGQTVLGRDMLAQDYLLKQLTASLIYPEKNLGKNFWDKVYAKANQMYGTTQISINTFNKVWILPDTAKVYEHKDTVFVVKSHLKVMLEEDYLALQKHSDIASPSSGVKRPNTLDIAESSSSTGEAKQSPSTVIPAKGRHARHSQLFAGIQNRINSEYGSPIKTFRDDTKTTNALGSQIVREVILPAIEQEVNQGQNFAQLRQIYNSMILAVWFKKNLKQALLNQVYTDKAKIRGLEYKAKIRGLEYKPSVILQKNTVILSETKDLNRINSLRDSSATPQKVRMRKGTCLQRAFILGVWRRTCRMIWIRWALLAFPMGLAGLEQTGCFWLKTLIN